MSAPDSAHPGRHAAADACPDTARPDTARPDTARPDTARPAAARPAAARPARADARRNREKLLTAARTVFASTNEGAPLEAIAREAGVGIGTLYRHFPTREALVEALYSAELDAVVDSAPVLLDELPPEAALRAWVERYAAFLATKRGMSDTLRAGWASGSIATPATRERITATIAMILEAGARTGALRADVEAEEVTMMLLGVFLSTQAVNSPERTSRLLGLVVDVLRPA
ncbi:TetR/AcrR family transcriptional regulator [Streptomyces kunmingensis]|uniref:TetR/AcrR family transcriptional regulator n=1 Tax=Streptomyces kunmingensis TaxID=68225 RepID=A0ABU6CLA7_9ACTN|nr:helix-turn-helix domain-containing protein [Streptomyces kunmingensis]MEB3965504.1 TetR/AcrR family transcriptional regulator [Streptomyces kunmingensis]